MARVHSAVSGLTPARYILVEYGVIDVSRRTEKIRKVRESLSQTPMTDGMTVRLSYKSIFLVVQNVLENSFLKFFNSVNRGWTSSFAWAFLRFYWFLCGGFFSLLFGFRCEIVAVVGAASTLPPASQTGANEPGETLVFAISFTILAMEHVVVSDEALSTRLFAGREKNKEITCWLDGSRRGSGTVRSCGQVTKESRHSRVVKNGAEYQVLEYLQFVSDWICFMVADYCEAFLRRGDRPQRIFERTF